MLKTRLVNTPDLSPLNQLFSYFSGALTRAIIDSIMAVLPRDGAQNDSTPGTKIATGLALVLLFCFVLIYSITKSKGSRGPALGVIRETGPQRRAAGLRGAELDSIPIFKFKTGRRATSKDIPLPPLIVEQDALAIAGQSTTTTSLKKKIQSCMTTRLPESIRAFSKKPLPSNHRFEPSLQICSICTEDFVDGDNIRRLPCHHIFHPRCIDPWLSGFAVTCPLWQVYPFSTVKHK